MTLKDCVLGGIAVVALVLGYFAFTDKSVMLVTDEPVGGTPGTEHTNSEFFNAGLSYGGGCFATSTTGTLTVNMMRNNCIYITATGAGQATLSLTLPTAANLINEFLPVKGSCRDWFIDASDVAAATTTTILAGTSVDLVGLDATGAGTGADVLDGAEHGKLTLCRQTDNGVTGYIQEWINAD